jgi:hypothetical protein
MSTLCCKRPNICISNSLCQNTKTPSCCWHEDKRDNKNIIYIDNYGKIDVTEFGLSIPQDLYYCPGCKITKEKSSKIINNLLLTLPPLDEFNRKHRDELNEQKKELIKREIQKQENIRKASNEKFIRLREKLREKEKGLKKKYQVFN